MPNRNIEGQYRYGYQGQEKDPETGMEAFQVRLWDSRLGRWVSTDPARQFSSPYLGMGNDPINSIDPDGRFKRKWWAKTVNFLIGGDGVSFNQERNEYFVSKTTLLESEAPDDLYSLKTVLYQRFYSNPIELYARTGAKIDHGIQGGLSLEAIGFKGALSGRHDVTNLIAANLEWTSKSGFDNTYLYNKFGESYGSFYEASIERESSIELGLAVVSVEGVYETSSNRSDDIFYGLLRGVGDLKSESESYPIYGTITTNYDGNSPVTTTTRSWVAGGALKLLFGLHIDAEIGYDLNYQVDK